MIIGEETTIWSCSQSMHLLSKTDMPQPLAHVFNTVKYLMLRLLSLSLAPRWRILVL